jgi:hypothetical protein
VAKRTHRFALVVYFEKIQKQTTGSETPINLYSGQWDADAILESYGMDTSKALVDRYFKISSAPTWKRFVNTADKVLADLKAETEDKRQRRLMKDKMKEWLV